MARSNDGKGVSLAKGPVLIIGLALLVFGALAVLVGGATSFDANPISGNVSGETFLGLELNGWSSLLFIAAGALLVFGSPLHWGAKSMSVIVGLALGAASVIALVDGSDVFGIFAANGVTKLVWGAAAAVLLLLALLPRAGGGAKDEDERKRDDRDEFDARRVVERERAGEFDRPAARTAGSDGSRVVAPAGGTTPESRETTRHR